ncbi:hypothetical protein A2331_03665 [Candidatus Falkowbacteria bacterium RIFOXYB2_FULL_34_18]|uniref:Uncharacterized protein n=1 Tax=Candidatus Falkowbacteria bacterium RIFOXYD2_FULL_34_120 TaxID=1798007 RepID=A0A1F5TSD6_9BACT|nr:MAG: hypothetical protein A2331_03665 [Candidatus Falkowbacteria bacterium RIFOXYB2_FULL_34_18]OGF30082.1 MAG: hypothetical protein A2500_04785 [Candidatus Falkowbacteria bacterium RIFOXYC12_FULL_34_55]OGF37584.1 MAG: hypothetical protein A2466_02060 [Candidatus Falkowbacteria bacterium RIFOXYC2_FULL_34_220]OGF39340.1 MAG: hypothetical protein A2515_02475 [Candidatus Falkowbacteria bacterium RIFOXYD12_FULL_34_57]OGF41845.1 MAG: hypothetical protein A2531_05460 [Candidatus Falkowbacteria bact
MKKNNLVVFIIIFFFGCSVHKQAIKIEPTESPKPTPGYFQALEQYAQAKSLLEPEYTLWDYQEGEDLEVQLFIINYIQKNDALMEKLKKNLRTEKVEIYFREVKTSYAYVPESRPEFKSAYSEYIGDINKFVLEKYKIKLPIDQIIYADSDYPAVKLKKNNTALIVNNLTKKFRVRCVFFSGDKKIPYWFAGSMGSNMLGSVTCQIYMNKDGKFIAERTPLSIWQTDTRNTYTLLSIPIEESLHYLIGEYTDKYIVNTLEKTSDSNPTDALRLMHVYFRVEEALVGGIVDLLLNEFFQKNNYSLPVEIRQADINHKNKYPQYKYRQKGIETVKRLGIQKSIAIYKDDPYNFVLEMQKIEE